MAHRKKSKAKFWYDKYIKCVNYNVTLLANRKSFIKQIESLQQENNRLRLRLMLAKKGVFTNDEEGI